MPIVQRTNLNQNTVLALWKISETKEQLFEMLNGNVRDNGNNHYTNIHWLASRLLLQQIFPESELELHKDEFNKPSLIIGGKPYAVSITHSYEYAAIMVSRSHAVALDMEKIDDRVIRVAHKFVRDDEQFGSENPAIYNTIIWSAKETLYKYYGRKELDFKRHLNIHPFKFTKGHFMINGTIEKDTYVLQIPINVHAFNDYILTFSIGI